MTTEKGQKRTYICISSSSDDEDEDEDESQSDSEFSIGNQQVVEISSSTSSDNDDDDEEEEESDDDDEGESEGSFDRVLRLLKDKSNLQELKLKDCTSYLRHHGLTTTGTKTECVERIMEHWRIKDGNAEAFNPRSSFVVDCTDGDEPHSESEFSDGNVQVVEISSSISCDNDDDDDESDDGEGESEGSCDRVIRLLRDKSNLQELKLKDCTSYLRHHGLRTTGTKTECLERIMEHWRVKDGNAEALYPRSSFVIDCTGDVCRGDVVLFKLKAYGFNKRRSKKWRCTRTIAGRVVRESYGAWKQQHTFTIEVLWSRGGEQLQPLTYLLVKGRKLYRMKTFRQLWKNESERLEVLAEKHERGHLARLVRAMNKAVEATSSKNRGVKRQKHQATSSKPDKRADAKIGNRGKKKIISNNHHRKAPRKNLKKRSKARAPESSMKNKAFTHPYSSQAFHQPQMHPNIASYHHHPRQNYKPISHFDTFSPPNTYHPDFHPNHWHHPHSYQDRDAHQSQLHHDTRFHPRHPHNFHQSEMHHHHQQRNAGHVNHCFDPPIIPLSENRGLNHVYDHSNVLDPRNVVITRSWG